MDDAMGMGKTTGRRVIGACAAGFVALVLTAGGAAAQDGGDYVGNPPPSVNVPGQVDPGGVDPGTGGRPGAVDPDRKSRGGVDGVLAFTGSDIAGLVAVGAGAVATGSLFRWRARRIRRNGLNASAA